MSGNPYLDDHEEQLAALVPDAPPAVVLPVPAAHPALAPYVPHVQQGYGPGADQAAYEAALQSRDDSDAKAKLYSALTMINKGGGGSGLDQGQAAQTAHRDDAIKAVLQRRALADSDATRAKEERMAALTEALAHPDSPESIEARKQFAATTVGQRIRERLGPDFERLTGGQVPGAKERLASQTQIELAGLKAGAKGGDEEAKRLAALEALRNVDPNMAAKFEHAPYDIIQKAGFGLVKQDRSIANLDTQKGIDRTLADAPTKEEHSMLKSMEEAFNPVRARAGLVGNQLKAATAAERLEILGSRATLTPQDIAAMAVLQATIANGGNAVTQAMVDEQIPKSLRSQGANWAQYLGSHPEDAGLRPFVDRALHVSRGEKATIEAQIRNELARNVPGFAAVIRKYPDKARGILKNAKLDLDKDFDPATYAYKTAVDPVQAGSRVINARRVKMPDGSIQEEGADGLLHPVQ